MSKRARNSPRARNRVSKSAPAAVAPSSGQAVEVWPSLPPASAFGLPDTAPLLPRGARPFDGRRRGVPPMAPPSVSTRGRGVSPAGFDSLERINSQARRLEIAHMGLEAAVIRARENHVGWDLIGQAVGLSGEGARSRWGR